jgi:hypothetical protein
MFVKPSCGRKNCAHWDVPDAHSYCYLLGIYLGDGHNAPAAERLDLRVASDNLYPEIKHEILAAIPNISVVLWRSQASIRRL